MDQTRSIKGGLTLSDGVAKQRKKKQTTKQDQQQQQQNPQQDVQKKPFATNVFVITLVLVLGALAGAVAMHYYKQNLLMFSEEDELAYISGGPIHLKHHAATKAPYWIHDPSRTPPPKTCEARFINFVARHGTRNPEKSDTQTLMLLKDLLISRLPQIKKNPKYQWLADWAVNGPHYYPHEQGHLVHNGELEHYYIARRMRKEYPNVFKLKYSPSRFLIQSTQVPRSGVSANAFAYGLFEGSGQVGKGRYQPFFINADNKKRDYLLRFFEVCENYQKHAQEVKSDITYKELAHSIYKSFGDRILKDIGIDDWDIEPSMARGLWTACALDLSIHNTRDRFCQLFTREDILRFEYLEDVIQYNQKGYAHKLNYEISCPLFNNFVDHMDRVVRLGGHTYVKANLMFAHAETVIPLVSLLGLFKDNFTLGVHNTPEQIEHREWKATKVSPFAANVAFVLYRCAEYPNAQEKYNYRVKVLHNESEQVLPACGEMYCPYDKFKRIFEQYLGSNCKFGEMCGISGWEQPQPIRVVDELINHQQAME